MMKLLKISEAAIVFKVSETTLRELINEAFTNPKSRWKIGKEIIDFSRRDAKRRNVRINPAAVFPC